MKILMVLTSHDKLGDTGHKTGFWVEEFAAPYYVFAEQGVDITLASPAGGQPPIDPNSEGDDAQTEATRRFYKDDALREKLAHTKRLSEVSADEFDAVFYPGGHGPLWDLVDDKDSIRLLESFWEQGKAVAAVCHAPAVLLNATLAGKPLVSGRAVAGFTNSEEEAVELTKIVPFLLEDELKAKGGRYESGPDWEPFILQDGLLITGQNPASSEPAAKALLQVLHGKP
ncbi:type 1 glutamine amidotransferase domain-containing protein [Aliidiomarina minuta]|uniref:Type 1 glutamine amidotransferase domain-containing protein n=1 Tax=Aliidiomarina minuta TaxID=880057 RepID=A0A432WAM1_9GAMM|nr:type 1 glutamine amidotransferase domain-containing protein [Aliidiomarina minuta]RUO27164.1 type 1 glutamine amidotransferase domain-containing protein [Aliidiomarina minuta]